MDTTKYQGFLQAVRTTEPLLNSTLIEALLVIASNPGCKSVILRDECDMIPMQVSRTVRALEDFGLIESDRSNVRNRGYELHLTRKGVEYLKTVLSHA